jgi:hypothetical protein
MNKLISQDISLKYARKSSFQIFRILKLSIFLPYVGI